MFAGVSTTSLAYGFVPSADALGTNWYSTYHRGAAGAWYFGTMGSSWAIKSDLVLPNGQHGFRMTNDAPTGVRGPYFVNSLSILGAHTDFMLVRTNCLAVTDGPWIMSYDASPNVNQDCNRGFGYVMKSVDAGLTQLTLGQDSVCSPYTTTYDGSVATWHVIAFSVPAISSGATYTTKEYLDGALRRSFSSANRTYCAVHQNSLGRSNNANTKYIDYGAILMYDAELSDNDVATISQYLLETYTGTAATVSWYLRNRNFTSTYTYTHQAAPPITPTFTYAVVRQNSSDIVWTINGQSHDFKLIQASDPSTNINGTAIAEADATQVAPADLSSASYKLTGAGIGQSWIDLRLFDRLLRQEELTGLYTNIQAAFDGVSDGYSFQPITVTWSPDTWTFLQNTAIDTKTIQVTNGSLAWVAEAKTSLSSGLSFNGTDLTGTPTALGNTDVTWRVYTTRTDSSGNEHRIHFTDFTQTLRVVTPITSLAYPALQVLRQTDFKITPSFADNNTTNHVFSLPANAPSWLNINSTTGTLQGIAPNQSTSVVITLTYTAVTTLSLQTTVTITVLNEEELWVAGALVYPENVVVTTLVPVNIRPTSVDPALDSFTVSPALPPSLVCEPQTGVISGSVTQASELTSYTVSATKTGFDSVVTASFALTVLSLTEDVRYPPLTALPLRTPTTITPTYRGQLQGTFETLQPLPAGLSLNSQTGVLTANLQTYTDRLEITCRLIFNGSYTVELTPFVLEPYHTLRWTASRLSYHVENTAATNFKANLPRGLRIDSTTGRISGNYESKVALLVTIQATLGNERAQGTILLPPRRKDLLWTLVWTCTCLGLGGLLIILAILIPWRPQSVIHQ